MGIQVYCGSISDFGHEWEQFIEVYETIKKTFDENKEIFLIYNFKLMNRQIDLLVIQENGICNIEFKSYKGEVIGTDIVDTNWIVKTSDGDEDLGKNLFKQLEAERKTINIYLENIYPKLISKINEKNFNKSYSWGYFLKGSKFDKNQLSRKNQTYYDIITCDNLILKLRHANLHYKLTKEDMLIIINNLNVGNCPNDDLRLTPAINFEELEINWTPNFITISNNFLENLKLKMKENGEISETNEWLINLKAGKLDNKNSDLGIKELLTIDKIVDNKIQSIKTGNAGSGKTIFLVQIFEKILMNYSEKNIIIPVFINLRNFESFIIEEQEYLFYNNHKLGTLNNDITNSKFSLEILKIITYYFFSNESSEKDLIENRDTFLLLIEQMITNKRFVFCLDGYDELNVKRDLDKLFNYILINKFSFILTTRQDELFRLKTVIKEINTIYSYILLPPNEAESNKYLSEREKKLGNTIKKKDFSNLSPLELYIKSLFSFDQKNIEKFNEMEILLYGTVLWDLFKSNQIIISNIKTIPKMIKFSKNEKLKRSNGEFYSIYEFINGPLNRLYTRDNEHQNASLKDICGQLIHLYYCKENNTNILEDLFNENQLCKLFLNIEQMDDISKSRIIIKVYPLIDYFLLHYIYTQYKIGNIISLVNIDVMLKFKEVLDNESPWTYNDNLSKFGTNTNEIIVNYLIKHKIEIKPTIKNPNASVDSISIPVSRLNLGVPKWYKELIEGILEEISKDKEPFSKQKKSDGLIKILMKIPERVVDTRYDIIIKDNTYGYYSESMKPMDYRGIFEEMFNEYNKPLEKHIDELFKELNRLPENNICNVCEKVKKVEKCSDINKLIKILNLNKDIIEFFNINNLKELFMDEMVLSHELEGNPDQIYYLNLLESELNDKLKKFAISLAGKSLYSYKGLIRHRADMSNDILLQYLSYRLIDIAKTHYLAIYAIFMWFDLLKGEDLGEEVGYAEGPDLVEEFADKAKKSLAAKGENWKAMVSLFDSLILNFKNLLYQN